MEREHKPEGVRDAFQGREGGAARDVVMDVGFV